MKGLPKNLNPSARVFFPLKPYNIIHKPFDVLPTANPRDRLIILDRQVLQPDRAETCQFGTDDEVARHRSPYDPTETTVDKEVLALREEYRREGNLHDPLLVSPANQEVSHILQPKEEHTVHDIHPFGSARGWSNKRKDALLRKEPYVFRAYEVVFPGYRQEKKVSPI
ncbi:hypothetical protein NUU61_009347 [Penicillium alfredii]|uniref:Uncharacterized protein n=1 Tax=Penicillium alfredii TaxID=1506179 RepID=A0A9W9EMX1_9EURO|nr:uncharacterized protein NUU61_009347 [Penicillium alfredii]KAJ5084768.1 hypothetical protein NUU61_009347 [Penicillium alfredii]